LKEGKRGTSIGGRTQKGKLRVENIIFQREGFETFRAGGSEKINVNTKRSKRKKGTKNMMRKGV